LGAAAAKVADIGKKPTVLAFPQGNMLLHRTIFRSGSGAGPLGASQIRRQPAFLLGKSGKTRPARRPKNRRFIIKSANFPPPVT
jgi:hypothetical protein